MKCFQLSVQEISSGLPGRSVGETVISKRDALPCYTDELLREDMYPERREFARHFIFDDKKWAKSKSVIKR
jgi:hypothetical protein